MKKIDYYPQLYKGQIYHIYNRGNGKENIFFSKRNYRYFLLQYDKYLSQFLDTFAFALLPNHFHLLVRIKTEYHEIISEQFRKFFISYAMSINKEQKRRGNLFQRQFKRKLIDNEKYFYAAVYYIHSNPVHHFIVNDLTEYPYTSYKLFEGESETKLCKNEVFEWFGGKESFFEYHKEFNRDIYSDNLMIEE
jgi:putative transposase